MASLAVAAAAAVFVGASADELTTITGRFYQKDILLYPSEEITYFAVGICDQSNHNRLVLSLAQPYNVDWDPERGNIYVEMSTEKESWTESTIFGTNYVQDNENGDTLFYKNITVPISDINGKSETIYIRVKGAGVQTTATWEITFDDEDEITNGVYDVYTFNENVPPSSTVFESADQYARSSEVMEIDNGEYYRIIFAFCADNFPFDPDSDFGVAVTIVGSPEYPESGFDLYLCPTSWETEYCKVTKYIDHNDDAISVVGGTIYNNAQGTSIKDGAVAAVLGLGGSGQNYFTATATLIAP